MYRYNLMHNMKFIKAYNLTIGRSENNCTYFYNYTTSSSAVNSIWKISGVRDSFDKVLNVRESAR